MTHTSSAQQTKSSRRSAMSSIWCCTSSKRSIDDFIAQISLRDPDNPTNTSAATKIGTRPRRPLPRSPSKKDWRRSQNWEKPLSTDRNSTSWYATPSAESGSWAPSRLTTVCRSVRTGVCRCRQPEAPPSDDPPRRSAPWSVLWRFSSNTAPESSPCGSRRNRRESCR